MAGNITGVLNRIQTRQGRPGVAEMVLTCTAHTDGSYPVTVINTLVKSSSFDIQGLKLYSVKSIPDATKPPTDASDLTILDEYGIDLLGGKGADFIKAASKTWTLVGPVGYNAPALITGDVTVNITNNNGDGAIVTLVLELTGD